MFRTMWLFLCILAACATTKGTGPSPDVPAWTKERCVVRDNTMHAVGSSNFADLVTRRKDADLAARAALATCMRGRLNVNDASVESYAEEELAGAPVVNHWVDPATGVEYATAVWGLASPK